MKLMENTTIPFKYLNIDKIKEIKQSLSISQTGS